MVEHLLGLIDPNEVRAALDPTGLLLDSSSLPNPSVTRQIYAGAAVTELLALDPDAAARGGEEVQRVSNALNLLTAANIAPFVTQILREQLDDVSTTYQAVDWEARGAKLRARARGEVAALTAAPAASSGLFMFGLASGRRGR